MRTLPSMAAPLRASRTRGIRVETGARTSSTALYTVKQIVRSLLRFQYYHVHNDLDFFLQDVFGFGTAYASALDIKLPLNFDRT